MQHHLLISTKRRNSRKGLRYSRAVQQCCPAVLSNSEVWQCCPALLSSSAVQQCCPAVHHSWVSAHICWCLTCPVVNGSGQYWPACIALHPPISGKKYYCLYECSSLYPCHIPTPSLPRPAQTGKECLCVPGPYKTSSGTFRGGRRERDSRRRRRLWEAEREDTI